MQRKCFGEVGNDLGLFGTNVTVQLFGCVDLTKPNLSLPPQWRGCQINPPFRAIQLQLENYWELQNSTWNYEPLNTGRQSFPVLQAGRNVREIQLQAQPAKVCSSTAHSAPGQPQHSEGVGKPLPQLLIRGWLGLGGFWCNWTGQAIEVLSIHCIKVTNPTIKKVSGGGTS